jgi:hypothetical protein
VLFALHALALEQTPRKPSTTHHQHTRLAGIASLWLERILQEDVDKGRLYVRAGAAKACVAGLCIHIFAHWKLVRNARSNCPSQFHDFDVDVIYLLASSITDYMRMIILNIRQTRI